MKDGISDLLIISFDKAGGDKACLTVARKNGTSYEVVASFLGTGAEAMYARLLDEQTQEQCEALDIAIKAIDRLTEKAPVEQEIGFGDRALACPTCGANAFVNIYDKSRSLYPHCPWCGQKLKTGEGPKP